MIPNVINVPSRPSTPVIAGPSRQRVRAQGRPVDVQQRSIADVLHNELESSDNDGSDLRAQTAHQGVRWIRKEKPEPAQIFDKNFGPSQIVKDLTDHTPYKICSLLIDDIRNIISNKLICAATGEEVHSYE
jgi:hypothetical protein